ncbi:hypothetical protein [Legionella drancourtii]|nr:hypothetical protein [Legionella drancourtii]
MSNKTHQKRQHKKFAFLMGSMNQKAFYKALGKIQDISIIAKFNQSGFSGFLPFFDMGVCGFFSLDYARAANEGRAHEWIKRIEKRDQEFIRYLIAERNEKYDFQFFPHTIEAQLISLSELNRATSNLLTHTHPIQDVAYNYQYNDFEYERDDPHPNSAENCAQIIANKMDPSNYCSQDTCMEAPHIQLSINVARKGLLPSTPFSHCLIFSMATIEKGGLDPAHLICVDANAGAFKIKNDTETIKKFLVAFDEQLVSGFNIASYELTGVTVDSIPKKGTDKWKKMKEYIQTDEQLGHDANYILSDLHQLNEFLRQQVEQLEASRKTKRVLFFKNTFETNTAEKIAKLKEIHRDTQIKLNELFQAGVNPLTYDEQLTEITKCMFSETMDAAKIHRNFFSFGQTESEKKLNQLNLSIKK